MGGRRGRGSGSGLAQAADEKGRGRGRASATPGLRRHSLAYHSRLHHRPLCVPAPAPEAPQPAALSSLIGSADGFRDWLLSRPAWGASSRFYWSSELLVRPPREVIARPLRVPGSSSGKPRVLPGSRLGP
ncbi:unnamed protein product [Rangifer tarandus platyrhynchus]|uniref:Uncharacterized protein n=2 Tax=Rangifer tarandus platyrhynchus TaxID=3082113 RepID=A0ACB0EQP2_RANTA|nr:unnamed protein product [Rangifer tarandus platyrhynchus]CAI9702995.1 unnamed protein product [Rangifer tarandus platyrhynchus]